MDGATSAVDGEEAKLKPFNALQRSDALEAKSRRWLEPSKFKFKYSS